VALGAPPELSVRHAPGCHELARYRLVGVLDNGITRRWECRCFGCNAHAVGQDGEVLLDEPGVGVGRSVEPGHPPDCVTCARIRAAYLDQQAAGVEQPSQEQIERPGLSLRTLQRHPWPPL
jgi:hypothetical protein